MTEIPTAASLAARRTRLAAWRGTAPAHRPDEFQAWFAKGEVAIVSQTSDVIPLAVFSKFLALHSSAVIEPPF